MVQDFFHQQYHSGLIGTLPIWQSVEIDRPPFLSRSSPRGNGRGSGSASAFEKELERLILLDGSEIPHEPPFGCETKPWQIMG